MAVKLEIEENGATQAAVLEDALLEEALTPPSLTHCNRTVNHNPIAL